MLARFAVVASLAVAGFCLNLKQGRYYEAAVLDLLAVGIIVAPDDLALQE